MGRWFDSTQDPDNSPVMVRLSAGKVMVQGSDVKPGDPPARTATKGNPVSPAVPAPEPNKQRG